MKLLAIASTVILLGPALGTQQPASLRHIANDGRLAPLLENLGNLHVPVTTSSASAQSYFDQGMRLVCGFNPSEALRSFREAARNDDQCAMAYWGQALALPPNINDSAIGPEREQQGYDAIREAVKRKSRATGRARALIYAIVARFAAKVLESSRTMLDLAYASAMQSVSSRFPDGSDIPGPYTDAVMNTRPWNYWAKDGQPQAGIQETRPALESTISRYPDHPGAQAVAAFQRPVYIEDGLLYGEPPDSPFPPRQYLARVYLADGMPAQAERIYGQDLRRHRHNGRSLRDLEQSLRSQGKTAEADRVEEDFRRARKRADIDLATSRF